MSSTVKRVPKLAFILRQQTTHLFGLVLCIDDRQLCPKAERVALTVCDNFGTLVPVNRNTSGVDYFVNN